jgi:putative chitinase
MKITEDILKKVMPNVEKNIKANPNFRGYNIGDIVRYLNKFAEEFDIDNAARWAHYLAQIAHESAEMRYTKELASGVAYDTGKLAKRLGNTPEADGDGQRYKGRGLIQLTGRANYEAYKKYCGFDIIKNPDLLAQPVGAIRSSMWFWRTNGLNQLADAGLFREITKKINGGTNHIEKRQEYLLRAENVLRKF